ncbi:formate/nitrite transporter family protein [Desulfosporosinus fructosivorans]|uniref:Formate/nitrite transporter family protein n=1 Tax=Desulfosporosinus fructosivorans TaxID=2018669 RepID=A0A4Z0R825_9FIRM|nr:formate/nitrite transporter family protein [Desulfosporosinus fructosivorans]TGE38293.1 formate/nitrite transporter family protein [Desulfosporosinus fructosivorans]
MEETKGFLTPAEIANTTVKTGIKKVEMKSLNIIVLGILAGAFIAFAAEGSNMAAFNLFAKPETYGLGKVLAGAIFGTGLMLVVLAGGELFTGNTMILGGVLDGKIKLYDMLKNWFFVYSGNFIGSLFLAYMMVNSGLFNSGANVLGGVTIKIASYKVGLSFMSAFYLGIMCNMLVCLAVWMAYGAKDMVGKILAIFFPIWLFITSGFEHSVANMYYIPAGILAKSNPSWVAESHLAPAALANLNWGTFIINNLVPVTLGNIVGGSIFVAGVYWFVYLKNDSKQESVASSASTSVAVSVK